MVLCNSQREEGLVPSQICRTSNRVIPQNYKINLEPIFNFLRLFYWIIVEKTSMSRSAGKTFFHFGASFTEVIFYHVTSGQFVHKPKYSFPIFELVPNLSTSEIKSSHDRTCFQIGNKSKSRNRTSRQFGEKLFLFPTSCREAVW